MTANSEQDERRAFQIETDCNCERMRKILGVCGHFVFDLMLRCELDAGLGKTSHVGGSRTPARIITTQARRREPWHSAWRKWECSWYWSALPGRKPDRVGGLQAILTAASLAAGTAVAVFFVRPNRVDAIGVDYRRPEKRIAGVSAVRVQHRGTQPLGRSWSLSLASGLMLWRGCAIALNLFSYDQGIFYVRPYFVLIPY
jgi:hypothetical protein